MQFTIAITALFAAAAFAAPRAAPAAAPVSARNADAYNALQTQAQAYVDAIEADGCHHIKCVLALAPTAVSCAAAAAEAGLDPIADAACIATLANTSINRPAACANC